MNKALKNILKFILTSIVSLTLLFVIFELFSQYHFGDVPTPVVTAKLIIGYILIEGIVYDLTKRRKKDE